MEVSKARNGIVLRYKLVASIYRVNDGVLSAINSTTSSAMDPSKLYLVVDPLELRTWYLLYPEFPGFCLIDCCVVLDILRHQVAPCGVFQLDRIFSPQISESRFASATNCRFECICRDPVCQSNHVGSNIIGSNPGRDKPGSSTDQGSLERCQLWAGPSFQLESSLSMMLTMPLSRGKRRTCFANMDLPFFFRTACFLILI